MKTKRTKSIGEIFAEGTLIDEALNQAVQDAVRTHKEAGQPLAVWKNGRTTWIQPREVKTQTYGRKSAARARRAK